MGPPGMGAGYSQLLMTPPRGSPLKSNSMSMYLPWGRRLGQGRGSRWEWQLHSPHPRPLYAPSPIRAHMAPAGSNPHPQVTHESGGVVVTDSLGVPKGCGGELGLWCRPGGRCRALAGPGCGRWGSGCGALTLQHGVGLQELLLHLVHLLPFAAHGRHEGHHQLAGLCQRGARGHRCGAVGAGTVPLTPPAPRRAPLAALAVPVLPAPLSPVMRMHWSLSRSRSER